MNAIFCSFCSLIVTNLLLGENLEVSSNSIEDREALGFSIYIYIQWGCLYDTRNRYIQSSHLCF